MMNLPNNENPVINIGYLIDTIASDGAGTEKQLIGLIRQLNDTRYCVTLICLRESDWMKRNTLPCRTFCLNYKGLININIFRTIRQLKNIIQNEKIDIVQTFLRDSAIIGLIVKMVCRSRFVLVLSQRDMGLGGDEPYYHKILDTTMRLLIGWFDAIAVNARAVQIYTAGKFKVPESRVTVIGNGLNIPAKTSFIPDVFVDHPADVWIGIVANLKPVKRVDILLHAMAHLKQRGLMDGVRAVILGEGSLKAHLKQLAEELGVASHIHFAGSVVNVTEYLQQIDIGVLCSDSEGLSNAILEYMACGLPVVATSVGGNAEMVDDANGMCVSPGNPVAVANALATLISSPALREKCGLGSLEKIHRRHVWNVVLPQWESYYQSLAGKNVTRGESYA